MALKLDMSKAYDRLEWSFVVETLTNMNFPPSLVSLIHRCISTVSYQVMINGQPSSRFIPYRGLRQGDPLSPYLFVICADVLSGLLRRGVEDGSIHGIRVARKSPTISHLFFADDSLLFARANEEEADRIWHILESYQQASGQLVNAEKSEISFSGNVTEEQKVRIKNNLGFRGVQHHSRYLGLPVIFGRSKKEVFKMVIERVWKKVKGWKETFLSRVGKEILIKAVAQAIPTYIMSCYRLPESCCREIEALLCKFWWGSKDGERKIHWVSWQNMAKAKCNGGMGFRGIQDFNTSLLGKQYWRLLQAEGFLLERVFKGRYYPNCSISKAQKPFKPSYAWRSITRAEDLLLNDTRWRIGNGAKVSIMGDRWIPTLPVPDSVSSLIDTDISCWKIDTIKELFNPEVTKHICSIPLSSTLSDDKLLWHHAPDGEYSVKSAYRWLSAMQSQSGPSSSSTNRCDFVRRVCFSSPLGLRLPAAGDIEDWLFSLVSSKDITTAQIPVVCFWKIWNMRNNVVFKGVKPMVPAAAQEIWHAVMEEVKTEFDTTEDGQQEWSKLKTGWLVQTDARCFDNDMVSLSCVIKDPTSNIFLAATKRMESVVNPTTAEALAIRWSIQTAKEIGIHDFTLQPDALTVVDCINGSGCIADIEPISLDCINLIFNSCNISIMFIRREFNTDAHNLVQLGKCLGSRCWTGCIPSINADPCNLFVSSD
ncbi:uncharacterized protein LOC131604327 [Vicia villosa]|uniref:uncharacterized protein LOC131604327 n=1 Tax=Vicia villosa TaxID=3911 RepID=UPI00273AF2D5|nr:uncharacterized protein LOC131604327 [Vicia villosa]